MLLLFIFLLLALLFYTSYGYLFFLQLFSHIIKENKNSNEWKNEYLPTVSLVISVYNGEKYIEKKIQNSLEVNYPNSKITIHILSDGCTDNTNKIVEKYVGDRIILHEFKNRRGKTQVLNDVIPHLSSELVVLTDIDAYFEQAALHNLVQPFNDKKVGFVTGYTSYMIKNENTIAESSHMYTNYENKLKRLETKIYSCINADGAIFAIRRELYPILKNDDINDLVIPLKILQKEYIGIFCYKAYCFEEPNYAIKNELSRQRRIYTRTIRGLMRNLKLLNMFKYKWISFFLFSHKILRILIPFLFLILAILSFIHFGYRINLISIFIILVIPVFGKLFKINLINKIYNKLKEFLLINGVILMAWLDYITGKSYVTWNK